MSFSNVPDADTLGRVAGALAFDEAFVEKDWYVVQAIAALVELGTDDITPISPAARPCLRVSRDWLPDGWPGSRHPRLRGDDRMDRPRVCLH